MDLQLEGVVKSFGSQGAVVRALRGVSMDVPSGAVVALMGAVSRLLITQALLISIIGSLVGGGAVLALVSWVFHADWGAAVPGSAWGATITIVLSILAAAPSAIRAGRLPPVDLLRGQ